jgi:hypothetical protein
MAMHRSIPLLLAALLPALPLAATDLLHATRPELTAPSDAVTGGETVTLTDGLAEKLLAFPFGQTLELAGWPLAPGVSGDILLTRREIYAADARLYRVDASGPVEIARSRLVFFAGRAAASAEGGTWLSIDPETGALAGGSSLDGKRYELRAAGTAETSRYTVAAAEAFLPDEAKEASWSCDSGNQGDLAGSALFAERRETPPFSAALASLHTATVAVDTDNEAMLKRFSDNTTSATNFIAQLLAAMNVMYERDLNVRLLQGTTFLRPSTTPDPYSELPSGTGTTLAELNEFSTYWDTNNDGIPRALALMLSGKLADGNSFAGKAWINGVCSTSVGYSFSHIFHNPAVSAAQNSKFVGHELGHNFGSVHTHCYSPPIDNCSNVEAASGCFSGTPSCPATSTINGVTNVHGTVMSYCHLLAGCSSSEVFHQRTLDVINPLLAPKVGVCVFPAGAGATAAKFYTVAPCRLIDTRNAAGTLGGPALAASGTRSFPATGTCGIPVDAKAISGNLTVVAPAVDGFLNAYATGTPTSVSLLNFRTGQVKANNVVLKLPASGGSLTFQNGSGGTANFLLDVNGYFK